MKTSREPKIETARVDWTGGGPRQAGGDIYFSPHASPHDGLAESRATFLDGIGAPDCWKGRKRFCVGETGFGTGLNFLSLWQRWRETADGGARLHFLSVEVAPPTRADAARALGAFPELAPLAAALLEAWPEPLPGIRSLSFDQGRVTLTLGIGDAALRLAEMVAPAETCSRGGVDAWFLDGFAPAQNPEIWSPKVIAEIARLSAPGARLATFTAAAAVHQDLTRAGFVAEKHRGFGAKRKRLLARFEGHTRLDRQPWFRQPGNQPGGKRVLVVGSGIAGATTARELHQAGFDVTVIDPSGQVGQAASGNPAGLITPRLGLGSGPESPFHEQAFIHAEAMLTRLDAGLWIGARGVMELAGDAKDADRLRRIAGEVPWPEDWLALETAEAASARLGTNALYGGLWHGRAGTVCPPEICRRLIGDIPVRAGSVASLSHGATGWLARDATGATLIEADLVILCAGAWLDRLGAPQAFDIRPNRGQIGCLPPIAEGGMSAISGPAYLTGPYDGPHGPATRIIGASYQPWDDPDDPSYQQLRDESYEAPVGDLKRLIPEVNAIPTPTHGRAALRATTPDHLPIAGPVIDTAKLQDRFLALHQSRGPLEDQDLFAPGLFALGGLGSRGLQTAPLLARFLAAQITGAPWPLPRRIAEAVHPARFLIRALKRA